MDPTTLPDIPPLPETAEGGESPPSWDLTPANSLAFRTPLQEHAPAADTKAAALLTVTGIMVTMLARYASQLMSILRGGDAAAFAGLTLVVAFIAASVIAVAQSFRTISPRFPEAVPSLAFFGDIAGLGREEYVRRVESLSEEQALEQILNFNHTGSVICVLKYAQLRIGIRAFKVAFGCWLMLMLMAGVRLLG